MRCSSLTGPTVNGWKRRDMVILAIDATMQQTNYLSCCERTAPLYESASIRQAHLSLWSVKRFIAITKKSFAIQSIAGVISADNAQSSVWHVPNLVTMPKTRRDLHRVKMCLSHLGSTMTINVGMWVQHASAQNVPKAWLQPRYYAPPTLLSGTLFPTIYLRNPSM